MHTHCSMLNEKNLRLRLVGTFFVKSAPMTQSGDVSFLNNVTPNFIGLVLAHTIRWCYHRQIIGLFIQSRDPDRVFTRDKISRSRLRSRGF